MCNIARPGRINAHVFRPNGRGRANQGIPATHRGHCDRRGAAGSACYEGKRRPEATGGDRRRPEATGGDRRRSPSEKPAFLIQIKKNTTERAVAEQPQHQDDGAGPGWRRLSCGRRHTGTSKNSAREAAQRREEAQCRRRERREGREENPQSTTHNDTNDSSSAGRGREERGPEETQSRAGDLRSRRGIQRRARSELRCVMNPYNRAVGSWR